MFCDQRKMVRLIGTDTAITHCVKSWRGNQLDTTSGETAGRGSFVPPVSKGHELKECRFLLVISNAFRVDNEQRGWFAIFEQIRLKTHLHAKR